MLLREAVARVLEDGSLTYREITDSINALRLYVPGDGMLVPEAQVRAAIRDSIGHFSIDRGKTPHKVSNPGPGR
jgi:hypothetical protein